MVYSEVFSSLGLLGGWCGGSRMEGCRRMLEDEVRERDNGRLD